MSPLSLFAGGLGGLLLTAAVLGPWYWIAGGREKRGLAPETENGNAHNSIS